MGYEVAQGKGPVFGLLVLEPERRHRQVAGHPRQPGEGHSKAFRIVVFTTGEPQTATTLQNTLHFIRVTPAPGGQAEPDDPPIALRLAVAGRGG